MKPVLKRKFITLSVFKKKLESSHTSNLTAHLKVLEKKGHNQKSRPQIMVKLRAEINQSETRRMIQRINKTKRWFFVKNNRIDKALAKLTKGQRDSIQINKIRNEKEDRTTETVGNQNITRTYYKNLYSTIL
jgi:CRISPR/Cas system-associated endoribonuclease Cas2